MSPRTPHPALTCNLALIGGRGCGKSSVSKRLARRNRGFLLLSVDGLIRYEAGGAPIPEIVEQHGWRHFRELEHRVVSKVGAFRSGALIDCGGGVVVDLDDDGEEVFSERKVEALRAHSRVLYLCRPLDYLVERIGDDRNRPSLSESHSFREIMERRDPWYRRAAHHVLEIGPVPKVELATRVLAWFYGEIGVDPEEARLSESAD